MTITPDARIALQTLLATTDALLDSLERGSPDAAVRAKWREIAAIVRQQRDDVRAGLERDDAQTASRGVNRLKSVNKAVADVDASGDPGDKAFAMLRDAVVAGRLLA